jgi:hypothetical protein
MGTTRFPSAPLSHRGTFAAQAAAPPHSRWCETSIAMAMTITSRFADRRWAGEEITHRRFAVAVELEHEAQINIHQQLRARVRV